MSSIIKLENTKIGAIPADIRFNGNEGAFFRSCGSMGTLGSEFWGNADKVARHLVSSYMLEQKGKTPLAMVVAAAEYSNAKFGTYDTQSFVRISGFPVACAMAGEEGYQWCGKNNITLPVSFTLHGESRDNFRNLTDEIQIDALFSDSGSEANLAGSLVNFNIESRQSSAEKGNKVYYVVCPEIITANSLPKAAQAMAGDLVEYATESEFSDKFFASSSWDSAKLNAETAVIEAATATPALQAG